MVNSPFSFTFHNLQYLRLASDFSQYLQGDLSIALAVLIALHMGKLQPVRITHFIKLVFCIEVQLIQAAEAGGYKWLGQD